jgi:hypothetical protein
MNKIEDYGLKAVKLAGEGKQLLMAAFFAFQTAKPLYIYRRSPDTGR